MADHTATVSQHCQQGILGLPVLPGLPRYIKRAHSVLLGCAVARYAAPRPQASSGVRPQRGHRATQTTSITPARSKVNRRLDKHGNLTWNSGSSGFRCSRRLGFSPTSLKPRPRRAKAHPTIHRDPHLSPEQPELLAGMPLQGCLLAGTDKLDWVCARVNSRRRRAGREPHKGELPPFARIF
jgi:hypothetical protein